MRTVIVTKGPLDLSHTEPAHVLFSQLLALHPFPLRFRLRAGQLDFRHERPFLCVPDAARFLLLLAQRNGRLTAFSTASQETLQALHGKVFHFQNCQTVQLRYTPDLSFAYGSRMIQLMLGPVLPANGLQTETDFSNTPVEGLSSLYFDPCVIDGRQLLRGGRLIRWFSRAFSRRHGGNLLVLPLVETGTNQGGPREPEVTRTRQSILSLAGNGDDVPAALTMARMYDHPLLSDLLAEGANLWVESSAGPTRLRLSLGSRPRHALARYRWEFLTKASVAAQAWPDVVSALRADLKELAGGIQIVAKDAGLRWDPLHDVEYCSSGVEDGSLRYLSTLADLLPPDLQSEFRRRVLEPARRYGSFPDHDLAERSFLSGYAPATWPSQAAFENWRGFFFGRIIAGLTGRALAGDWHHELVRLGCKISVTGASSVSYSPTHDLSTVERWRLLAPLGTVFTPNLQARLDEARLDIGCLVSESPRRILMTSPVSTLDREAIRPGALLTSKLLAGAEQASGWLRSLFDPSHGLVDFDLQRSLTLVCADEQWEVHLQHFSGLSNRWLSIVVDWQPLVAHIPKSLLTEELQIYVEIDPSDSSEEADDKSPPRKFELRVRRARDAGELPGHHLQLGRYRVDGQTLCLTQRPPLALLSALRPIDSVWLAPLLDKLELIAKETAPAKQDLARRASDLLVDWSDLTVYQLVVQLGKLRERVYPSPTCEDQVQRLRACWHQLSGSADALPLELAAVIDKLAFPRGLSFQLQPGRDYVLQEHWSHGPAWTAELLLPLPAGEITVHLPAVEVASICLKIDACEAGELYVHSLSKPPYVFRTPPLEAGMRLTLRVPHSQSAGEPKIFLKQQPAA